ncbi:MAG: hypoxanthine phosphoribosyltransferase [Clostridia bacterium]|nr:hypoxanthine phosphoribosyltransferase [Clostridia bacterium]
MYGDIQEVLIRREEIANAVKMLGDMITRDYEGKAPVMVCILKGASVFYVDLLREIDLPVTMEFMIVSSYGKGVASTGNVRIRKDLDYDISGRDVILVEDIVDTGLTLSFLKKMFIERGAQSVKIATLLDKPARRKVDLKADYYCFTVPDAFVVGYGLDYAERYRNLPDIGILKSEIYEKRSELELKTAF